MYPNYSQFPEHAPDPKKVPKKIKSSGGANPYKQLNQMLDFQIKQAKLDELKKKKEKWPPRVKLSFNKDLVRLDIQAAGFLLGQ